jgi:hypothetical protein
MVQKKSVYNNKLGEIKMSDKNIEIMKKLIEEKKRKSSQQGANQKPEKNIGSSSKGFYKNTKQGGQFDK